MASNVVVIDPTARRRPIKTQADTRLIDVLKDACNHWKLDFYQYGLKHNKKTVDLSLTFRRSGLPTGAKLELIQLSRSAGVVQVALQLPESEAQGVPNGRLTDKFPSTTTLWLVLRKFEAGVAGQSGMRRNLTAKGAPSIGTGTSGAGRLYYQQPVIQGVERELSSFTDLQKSLGDLGLNAGSTLLRLSFRTSDTPLEEAMEQIQAYFDSVDGVSTSERQAQHSTRSPTTQPVETQQQDIQMPDSITDTSESIPAQTTAHPISSPSPPVDSSDITPQSPTSRPLSVFRPPSSTTPSAALATYNPSDYTPTVEHAQQHQRMLSQSTRNVRLPTEAEIAAQAASEADKLAGIKEVEIKIKFPDESAVSSKFGQLDTAAELYTFVRECMQEKWRTEAFFLRNPGVRGKGELIPDDGKRRIIRDLQIKGRVLVIFGWDESKASMEARGTKSLLRDELRAKAAEIKVQDIAALGVEDKDDPGTTVNVGKDNSTSGGDGDGKKRMPKWLNKLGKK